MKFLDSDGRLLEPHLNPVEMPEVVSQVVEIILVQLVHGSAAFDFVEQIFDFIFFTGQLFEKHERGGTLEDRFFMYSLGD